MLILFLPIVLGVPLSKRTDYASGYNMASEHLLASLNLTADPCTDFFDFSCGKWLKNNPIPPYMTAYSSLYKMREGVQEKMKVLYEEPEMSSSSAINKLRLFYRSCMNEEEIDNSGVQELLNSELFKNWPLLNGNNWKNFNFNFTDLLVRISQQRSANMFFDSSVKPDVKNVTRRRIYFDQGSLGMGAGSSNYYTNTIQFAKQINVYRELLIRKIALLLESAGQPVNSSRIIADVEAVIQFEIQLARIMTPEENRRNFTDMYHLIPINELNRIMPMINWKYYFNSISESSAHDIDTNSEVIVIEPAFFERLSNLLKSSDPKVVTNYAMIRFLAKFDMELGTKFQNINQNFSRQMYGQKERLPRWKECVTLSNGKMPFASGAMYVRKYFDQKSKEATLEIVSDLQEAFLEMLKENEWMDEQTKQLAIEKAKAMRNLVGYPDLVLDDNLLDEWYKELQIDESDSFMTMNTKISRFYMDLNFKRLQKPVDRDEFESNAAIVNALYSTIKNAIILNAAILQIPVFDSRFPMALNFGGIGSVIGHEITHGFDDQGRQYDSFGNLRDWWDSPTSEKYKQRANCIIEQYGNITVNEAGMNINGKLTQGENIADNGGIKEAFRAYKRYLKKHGVEDRVPGLEQFGNEQMFFIGYAQNWCGHMTPGSMIRRLLTAPHSPDRFRVNIALQNQPEFAAAFKCPPNSPMNPTHRCSVW